MELPIFTEIVCKPRNVCSTCRTSTEWRQMQYEFYKMPQEGIEICPYDVKIEPNKIENLTGFAKSIWSKVISSPVDEQVKQERIKSCHGDDKIAPCPYRVFHLIKQMHFCGGCGCGDKYMARLDSEGSKEFEPLFKKDDFTKLDYPYLECPKKAPGFSNYIPPSGI